MYAASRIVLALKKKNEGYEETKKLSEEEPVRFVLIYPGLPATVLTPTQHRRRHE